MTGINSKLVNSGRIVCRMNVGMENAPDLIADLENGLKHLVNSREPADGCSA